MSCFFIVSRQTALQQTIPLTPESFDRFSNLIDPDWIDQALQTTGTASIRRRRLPAERVVGWSSALPCFATSPSGTSSGNSAFRFLLGAEFGSFASGELSYARARMAETPDHSLTIFDRAYYAAAFLLDWQQAGQQRHWLMRAKTALRYEVVHTLGEGDWWVRLPVSQQARQSRPDLPSHWEPRLIECRHGGEIRRYLTSLADAQRYRGDLLADHYRQRWGIELGYRDSKQPTLVRQEIWGLLIAYNLLREEMR